MSGTNTTIDQSGERPVVPSTGTYITASFEKEHLDLAFASELLGKARFSERQLALAIADWSLYGDTSLGARLIDVGLLSAEDRDHLETAARARLERVLPANTDPDQSNVAALLERLDPTGRVARLMGSVTVSSSMSKGGSRTSLGHYTLIRKLGQGGIGTVWLARDENIKRYVALKEVSLGADSAGHTMARFRREAEITGRLEHPSIVPVYHFGEDQHTGRAFYAMRFLGKQTLQQAIDDYHERRSSNYDDPMLLRNLLSAFYNICNAVAHAHSRKVIHRDLKPTNVAINTFGQVIVIDWGMAKILDEADPGTTGSELAIEADLQQTVAGQVLGTPLYMAPEQAAGRIDSIDERTDVYGLGAILFAILTGAAPHERTHSLSTTSGARSLIRAIAEGHTPVVSEANPDIDPALAAICERAMAKRSYARYQSAFELGEEIQRWMAGEPVAAAPESLLQRLGRWILAHKRLSHTLGALLIVILVAGSMFGVMAYQAQEAVRQTEFDGLRAAGREIKVRLTDAGQDLRKDVRFMSTLPPIQALIATQSGSPMKPGEESEDVWRERLETIYAGLLRANPNYLSVAYLAMSKEDAQGLVRVERYRTDPAYLRRVPRTRLGSQSVTPFLKEVLALPPGEVKFTLSEQAQGGHPRLLGAIPVYSDLTGDPFGLVVIEAGLFNWVRRTLDGLSVRDSEIYITRADGQIWLTSLPEVGIRERLHNANIDSIIPELASFFTNTNIEEVHSVPGKYIALHVRLDPDDPQTAIGVVLRLNE